MLSAQILARIRRLEIKSAKLVQEIFAGKYTSVFKGRGIEFSDVRDYQWGDDIRAMHWKAMARFAGKPFIKRFTEERELTVILAVDISGSLGFGSRDLAKREVAQDLGGLIAYLALQNKDRVGLLLFTDQIELYLPPKSRRTLALRIMRELVSCSPQSSGTNIKAALSFLLQTLKKRAIIFLISDFLGQDFEKELKILGRKHDLIAVTIADPLETTWPALPATLRLSDLENADIAWELNLRHAGALDSIKQEAEEQKESLRQLFSSCGAGHLELSTETDFTDALIAFFAKREKIKMQRG